MYGFHSRFPRHTPLPQMCQGKQMGLFPFSYLNVCNGLWGSNENRQAEKCLILKEGGPGSSREVGEVPILPQPVLRAGKGTSVTALLHGSHPPKGVLAQPSPGMHPPKMALHGSSWEGSTAVTTGTFPHLVSLLSHIGSDAPPSCTDTAGVAKGATTAAVATWV